MSVGEKRVGEKRLIEMESFHDDQEFLTCSVNSINEDLVTFTMYGGGLARRMQAYSKEDIRKFAALLLELAAE